MTTRWWWMHIKFEFFFHIYHHLSNGLDWVVAIFVNENSPRKKNQMNPSYFIIKEKKISCLQRVVMLYWSINWIIRSIWTFDRSIWPIFSYSLFDLCQKKTMSLHSHLSNENWLIWLSAVLCDTNSWLLLFHSTWCHNMVCR